jgi:hypothetical protein
MKRYVYRFDTLGTFIEEVSGLKVALTGEIIGVYLTSLLHEQFGTRARRHYPYGAVMVLPTDAHHPFVQEMPDEQEWERDWEREMIF